MLAQAFHDQPAKAFVAGEARDGAVADVKIVFIIIAVEPQIDFPIRRDAVCIE